MKIMARITSAVNNSRSWNTALRSRLYQSSWLKGLGKTWRGTASLNSTKLIVRSTSRTWGSSAETDGQTSRTSRYWRSPAESINDHYAAISTNPCYTSPHRNDTANLVESVYISEWQVFDGKLSSRHKTMLVFGQKPIVNHMLQWWFHDQSF